MKTTTISYYSGDRNDTNRTDMASQPGCSGRPGISPSPESPRREAPKEDAVNNPGHYTVGKVECIDALDSATLGLTGQEAFHIANVIKYCWRWKFKGGVEDLKKARWYLDRLIKVLS